MEPKFPTQGTDVNTSLLDEISHLSTPHISDSQAPVQTLLEGTSVSVLASSTILQIKLGHQKYKEKSYLQALEYYRSVLAKANSDEKSEIDFGMGQVFYQLKQYSESYLYYSLVTSNPASSLFFQSISYIKLASILKFRKDFPQVLILLLKIVKNKDLINSCIIADAVCLIGTIHEAQGNTKISRAFYRKALKISKSFRTVSCVAWAYLNISAEVSDSICKEYLTVERPDYEWSDMRFLRALAQAKLRNFQFAIQLLEEQVRAYPGNILYIHYLGIFYYKSQNYEKAFE